MIPNDANTTTINRRVLMAHPDKKLPKLNTAAQNIQTEIRSSTKKPQKTNQMNINGRSIFAFILIFLIAFITLNATISQIRENVKIDDTSAGITETESIPESEITTYAEINGIKASLFHLLAHDLGLVLIYLTA